MVNWFVIATECQLQNKQIIDSFCFRSCRCTSRRPSTRPSRKGYRSRKVHAPAKARYPLPMPRFVSTCKLYSMRNHSSLVERLCNNGGRLKNVHLLHYFPLFLADLFPYLFSCFSRQNFYVLYCIVQFMYNYGLIIFLNLHTLVMSYMSHLSLRRK